MNNNEARKGKIRFIHFKDNKEYCFVTEVNNLNNNQMYSFDNWGSCYASNWAHVKSIIKGLHKKAKVLESDFSK